MDISSDWLELLKLLQLEQVRFLIVGGHAISAYGYPRYTEGLDIFVEASQDNAERLMVVLNRFFDANVGFNIESFVSPDKVVMIGQPPFRVDLLTSIDGVRFEDADANKQIFNFGGIELPFIAYDHLIANKQASGRPKDLGDVGELELRRKQSD